MDLDVSYLVNGGKCGICSNEWQELRRPEMDGERSVWKHFWVRTRGAPE